LVDQGTVLIADFGDSVVADVQRADDRLMIVTWSSEHTGSLSGSAKTWFS
jgi:hypothetical protein